MNLGLTALWFVVVVVIITMIIITALAIQAWNNQRNVTLTPATTTCIKALDSLPSVANLDCCYLGSTLTASRYVPSLDMVVNPVAIPYLGVCQGYCSLGITASGTCVNGSGQAAYDQCISISAPVNCTDPAMPVAALGTLYMYPNSATDAACQLHAPCT